ncbi:polysaccharide deacetylase [Luteitalea sp. TBR-22]|uniref:XrtA system polysaccharide deacetylase n=1 Tax=Luteitalea sp. TBR-22 TaxID=2802971 RepID=UPI001AFA7C1D|nr:XrtA system polysaccharide deacetylase [Luteitalea sp. TBR-22]BCS33169.1 polysaccharide deacetylase [Luteitalea sp. TBR-22]
MSIDVEEYFHASALEAVAPRHQWETLPSRVVPTTQMLLELFASRRVRATFFVLGWVADRYPALVREIAAAGHEIASHGYWHEIVYTLTPDAFREDVRRSKQLLEDLAGTAVRGYRAPSFSITRRSLWALDVLLEEGYAYDASVFPVHHDRYGIPDAPRHSYTVSRPAGTLQEVPPSTVHVAGQNLAVAGGGYFRLLPYGWTRAGISRLNRREGRSAIFYLHPWEIDTEQPRLPVGMATRLRHYGNLGRTMGRLTRLIDEFRFAPVVDVVAAMGPLPAHTLD